MLGPGDLVRLFESSTKASRLALGLFLDRPGSTQVSLKDLQETLDAFLWIAEKRMDPAIHEAFVRDCDALVREQLGY